MTEKIQKRNRYWGPKGRSLMPAAAKEINLLLEAYAPKRELLIEFLHKIQDQYGCLHVDHLHALSAWMGLAPVEVMEVASFYHHFDIVQSSGDAPPPLTVRVCDSISCMLSGAEELIRVLDEENASDEVRIQRVPCVGRCDQAPVAVLGQNALLQATPEQVALAIRENSDQCEALPGSLTRYLDESQGYAYYQSCLKGEYSVEEVITCLEESGLRGLGGAGFPVGRKWRILREQTGPRWIAVNIDEGEPGTFKDRYILEQQPHALLEGLLIAAWAIESTQCVLYVRDEYPAIRQALQAAIDELGARADFDLPQIQIRRGAGAYICGEESAMLESIEGKRGYPRQRPPFIAEKGLFGQPTLEHNAESLCWIPELLQQGAGWFKSSGANGRSGLRRYSLSGRIKRPGVFLAPAGISVRQLIDEYGGGMLDGHVFYGYLPGGASGGILPARLGDVPLDFDTLQVHGCFIGSAAVIVFSEQDRARDIALNAMRFFAHESCGQCTPCRVGTAQAAKMMTEKQWASDDLERLACIMEDASICGLGQAAPNPLRCVMKYFPAEVRGD